MIENLPILGKMPAATMKLVYDKVTFNFFFFMSDKVSFNLKLFYDAEHDNIFRFRKIINEKDIQKVNVLGS